MNIKKFIPSTKRFVIVTAISASVSALCIVLVNHRVLPKNKWSGDFGAYDSYREMLLDGGLLFFGLLIIIFIIPLELKYKEKSNSNDCVICPSCENVQEIRKKQDVVLCEKCGQTMVPLKGYYDKDKKGGSVL